jgi:hypothetical protein
MMKIMKRVGKAPSRRWHGKPRFADYLKASAIASAAAAPLPTLASGFSGDYAVTPPANGVYSGINANGAFGNWNGSWSNNSLASSVTLDTSSAPSQISMNLSTGQQSGFEDDYTFLVQAAGAGLVSFNYSTTLHLGNGGGPASASFVDETHPASSPLDGSGSFMATVSAGDIFGFELSTGYNSSAALTLSDFSAPVPEPSTWLAGGLSLASLLFMQRRRIVRLLKRAPQSPDAGSSLDLLTFGFVGLLAYRAAARRRAVIGD